MGKYEKHVSAQKTNSKPEILIHFPPFDLEFVENFGFAISCFFLWCGIILICQYNYALRHSRYG